MAYNYLDLVNRVCVRLNEVKLSETNFDTADGFYDQAKEAVNAAIQDINAVDFDWPFNHEEREDVMSEGVARYDFPVDAKNIDFESFRLVTDTNLLVSGRPLRLLTYNEYLERLAYKEDITDGTAMGAPSYVSQALNYQYIISPPPDKEYTIKYDYFKYPVDLVLWSDVPNIPERYRHVVIDGAMYHAYMFRDNIEQASKAESNFNTGIKNMRKILVNRNDYVRSGMLEAPRGSYSYTNS